MKCWTQFHHKMTVHMYVANVIRNYENYLKLTVNCCTRSMIYEIIKSFPQNLTLDSVSAAVTTIELSEGNTDSDSHDNTE